MEEQLKSIETDRNYKGYETFRHIFEPRYNTLMNKQRWNWIYIYFYILAWMHYANF